MRRNKHDAKEFILKFVKMCNDHLICNTCIAKNYSYLCSFDASFYKKYTNKELEGVAKEFVDIVENWHEIPSTLADYLNREHDPLASGVCKAIQEECIRNNQERMQNEN
jgi:hypothetical protein